MFAYKIVNNRFFITIYNAFSNTKASIYIAINFKFAKLIKKQIKLIIFIDFILKTIIRYNKKVN